MKSKSNLWDHEEPIIDHASDGPDWTDVLPPAWISQDISPSDVAAIVQGGCDSGAYMPAVTYWQARETMAEHGDAIVEYIEEHDDRDFSELLRDAARADSVGSWDALAVWFVSSAVETWAGSVEDELGELLSREEEEEEDGEEGSGEEEPGTEPEPEDYVLAPTGPLGSRVAVSVADEPGSPGRYLASFDDQDAALDFIRARMASECFFPSTWRLDDHGGWHGPLDPKTGEVYS